MAKQTLQTNYKDDVLATSMGKKRRYNLIQNDDGTISLEDATEYTQVGDNYGAAQLNATNQAVNESVDQAKIIDSLDDILANTQPGMVAGALAVDELNGKSGILISADQNNPITEYQLYKMGKMVVFNVTNYKKGQGAVNGRVIGTIQEGFLPPHTIAISFGTSGIDQFDSSGNPGSRIFVNDAGVVMLYCNKNTGNYISFTACWVTD